MKSGPLKSLKIIVFALLLVFYSSFLFYKMNLPAADDLPRQMENGKNVLSGEFSVLTKNVYSYTEPDHPFANHHWLSGVVFYLLHQAIGFSGMSIFKVTLMLATFVILFRVALKKADFWLVTFFSMPTLFVLMGRSSLRPELFSYFFIALYLYLLIDLEEHPERNRIFWLIPVQLLWTNMHLFSVIGVVLVAGFLFEKIVLKFKNLKSNPLVKKLILLLISLALVLAINPFGLRNAFSSFRLTSSTDSPIASAETVSISYALKTDPPWSNMGVTIFEPMTAILAISFVFGFWKKRPIFYSLANVTTGVLGFFVVRSLPLFGLMFLPAVTGNFNGIYTSIKNWIAKRWPERKIFLEQVMPLILIIALLYFTIFDRAKIADGAIGIGITAESESSAKFFKEQGLKGPIYNDTDIGSYLIYELYPQEKVFSDNRFRDAYSASFFRDEYAPIINGEKQWQAMAAKYNFNIIFLNHYNNVSGARDFLARRMSDSQWPLVYADRYAVIFVSKNSENTDVIKKFQITSDNAGQKLSYLLKSPDPDDQLAGADLLVLMGRMDLAMPAYMKVVVQWPERGKVWLVMGKIELERGDQENLNPALALLYIQQAIKAGWKTPESYSYLALAYYRLGDLKKTEEAVNQELKIDPKNEDGLKWLKTLAEEKTKQGIIKAAP